VLASAHHRDERHLVDEVDVDEGRHLRVVELASDAEEAQVE
jgi:hypothetical protein